MHLFLLKQVNIIFNAKILNQILCFILYSLLFINKLTIIMLFYSKYS